MLQALATPFHTDAEPSLCYAGSLGNSSSSTLLAGPASPAQAPPGLAAAASRLGSLASLDLEGGGSEEMMAAPQSEPAPSANQASQVEPAPSAHQPYVGWAARMPATWELVSIATSQPGSLRKPAALAFANGAPPPERLPEICNHYSTKEGEEPPDTRVLCAAGERSPLAF